jgi:anti-anti-sigma factor
MAQGIEQTAAASRSDGIQVVHAPDELDMATADGLAARGCAAAVHARLLLLDLSGLSFCDARGLSALVQIANYADRTRCRYGLIAPQPRVAKVLQVCRLDQRLPVFAAVGDALENLTAMAGAGAQSKEVGHESGEDRMRAAGQIACGQAADTPVDGSPVTASPLKASPEYDTRQEARASTGQADARPPCPSRARTAPSLPRPSGKQGKERRTQPSARGGIPGGEAGACQGGLA